LGVNYEKISETFKAMAHSARLKIVAGLPKNKRNVSQIQKALGLRQSTIPQHLGILKNVGIIQGRKKKTRT